MKPVFLPRNHLMLMALAACYPVIGYSAGTVRLDFAVGSVVAVAPSGTQRPLTKGADIFSGETIRTGSDGRAQLRFDDGAMVSLQPQSEFRLDNYQFSGVQNGQEKGLFSLLKGGFRTLTGLVGRANKDNYKVTTSVATIGIRGTEYTISYLDSNAISIATGEGAIEVCNGAGCVILSSGDSAIVEGPNSPLRLTDSRPRLDPPQVPQPLLAVFSTSEGRNSDGGLSDPPPPAPPPPAPLPPAPLPPAPPPPAPPSPPAMVSEPGYAMAYAKQDTSFGTPGFVSNGLESPVTTTFGSANELLTAAGGFISYSATTVAGALSADGVLGWGRWSSATSTGFTASLVDVHYAVGKPTSDLTALSGVTATYNLIGYTLPTDLNGNVGQAPSGTLTASFSASLMTVSINLSVPMSSISVHTVSGSTFSASLGPTFSINSACSSVSGFFAGANASHAGITYKVDVGGPPLNYVTGAAAFKR